MAVGCEASIIIYIPNEDRSNGVQWIIQEIIPYSNVKCLDWSDNNNEGIYYYCRFFGFTKVYLKKIREFHKLNHIIYYF